MTIGKQTRMALAFVAAFLAVQPAFADISLGAFGGHGLPPAEDGDDPFRWGFGGRLGFTLPIIPIYIGAAATAHLGSEDGGAGTTSSLRLYGLEGGLDLDFDGVGLRAYALGGAADLETTQDKDGGLLGAYVGLGVMPSLRFIDLPAADFYLGIDARYVQMVTATRADDGTDDVIEEQYYRSFPVYLTLMGRFL